MKKAVLSGHVSQTGTYPVSLIPTYSQNQVAGRLVQSNKLFPKRIFFVKALTFQVIDFKEDFFCFSNGQFSETRMESRVSSCQ